jgi:hypothetical protein
MAGLRAVMAMSELGMLVINTHDFCGMGTKDPKGKQWHSCDWGSNDGVSEK